MTADPAPKPRSYRVPVYAIHAIKERTIALPRAALHGDRDALAVARSQIATLAHEELLAIMLDGRNRVVGVAVVARGMSSCAVRPSDVLRAALACKAKAFILAHNHPSGDPTPSPDDATFTDRIARAAALVGLPLLDHLIVTDDPERWSRVPLPDLARDPT